MINRCGSTVLRSLVALAALAVLATLLTTRDAERAEATDWQPTYGYCLDDAATGLFTIPLPVAQECDGNPAAGFPSDTRTTLTIPSGMYNFGGGAGFTPAAAVDTQSPIPLGAVVGRLASKATLGLIGNPCSNSIDVFFTFQFSSLDLNDTIKPKLPGQTNQLEFFALDDDGDGLPNAVEKYPEYLKKLYDPDYSKGPDGLFAPDYGGGDDVIGPEPPLQPVARATGFSIPAGTGIQVVLNILFFPPGSNLKNANNTDMPAFDSSLGYAVGTALQDTTVPVSPGAISDFCSPLDVVTYGFGVTRDNPCTGPGPTATNAQGCAEGNPAYPAPYPVVPDPEGCDAPGRAQPDPDGNEASCTTRKNPAAGTYSNVTFARSLRDDDGDGLENTLDSCPLVPSPGFNPRAPDTARDGDSDGLPNPPEGCDPAPTVRGPQSPPNCTQGNVGPDTDGDCYADRGDNCAAVLLPDNTIDINKSYNKGQEDQDADGIGDTCDPTPTAAEGHRHEFCVNIDVTYPTSAAGVASAPYGPPCVAAGGGGSGATPTPAPACTADADSDGVCDDTDRCAGTPAGATVDSVGCTPEQAVLDDDKDGVANAKDACPNTAAGAKVDAEGCAPGQTRLKAPGGSTAAGGPGGPVTGVGSLSPVAGSVPAWAAILAAFGAAGAIGSLGYFGARQWRRRD